MNKIKELLKDYELHMQLDIEDIDYLDEFLKERGINLNCSLIELGTLYNMFSEECWSASWTDNAEGQFIQWLQEKDILSNDKIFIDMYELQEVIASNLFSKETNKYYSHTDMTEEERSAFTQGMAYASILATVKCEKYRMVEKDD